MRKLRFLDKKAKTSRAELIAFSKGKVLREGQKDCQRHPQGKEKRLEDPVFQRFSSRFFRRKPFCLFGCYLLQQAVGMAPFVDHEQHIADVYTNATGQTRVEIDVRREAVPVAIESKSDETSPSVEHG